MVLPKHADMTVNELSAEIRTLENTLLAKETVIKAQRYSLEKMGRDKSADDEVVKAMKEFRKHWCRNAENGDQSDADWIKKGSWLTEPLEEPTPCKRTAKKVDALADDLAKVKADVAFLLKQDSNKEGE